MLGVYRSAMKSADAVLPYVYTSPLPDTILRGNDKLYLFGNPSVIAAALKEFRKPFTRDDKGNLGIDSNIPEKDLSNFRKSSRGNLQGRPSRIILEEEKESTRTARGHRIDSVMSFSSDNDEREKSIIRIQAAIRGHNSRARRKKYGR